MTTAQANVLIAALVAIGVLFGWVVRLLWKTATVTQRERDAIGANTVAVRDLTTAVAALTERVARLEGPQLRRPGGGR